MSSGHENLASGNVCECCSVIAAAAGGQASRVVAISSHPRESISAARGQTIFSSFSSLSKRATRTHLYIRILHTYLYPRVLPLLRIVPFPSPPLSLVLTSSFSPSNVRYVCAVLVSARVCVYTYVCMYVCVCRRVPTWLRRKSEGLASRSARQLKARQGKVGGAERKRLVS